MCVSVCLWSHPRSASKGNTLKSYPMCVSLVLDNALIDRRSGARQGVDEALDVGPARIAKSKTNRAVCFFVLFFFVFLNIFHR